MFDALHLFIIQIVFLLNFPFEKIKHGIIKVRLLLLIGRK